MYPAVLVFSSFMFRSACSVHFLPFLFLLREFFFFTCLSTAAQSTRNPLPLSRSPPFPRHLVPHKRKTELGQKVELEGGKRAKPFERKERGVFALRRHPNIGSPQPNVNVAYPRNRKAAWQAMTRKGGGLRCCM